MSAALMTEAAAKIQRQTNTIKKMRQQEEAETGMLIAGAVGLAAAGGAGLVDAKWGSQTEGPAKVKGIPVNAMASAVLLGAALAPLPSLVRACLAQSGAQLAGISLYRFAADNAKFE